MSTTPQENYLKAGTCPICDMIVIFGAESGSYRDNLKCSECGSIPRERALALVLGRVLPGWRDLAIHESSPVDRGISAKLAAQAPGYVATQFVPGEALGSMWRGFRIEDLERQTFDDASFDVVVSLDVLEHVNEPSAALAEIARTLRPGGVTIFTVPTFSHLVESERRARHLDDGTVEHLAPPEYHGNPMSEEGSLVTFHYGYDLPALIHEWSGLDVEVTRFWDPEHGIIGDMTEVYVAWRTT